MYNFVVGVKVENQELFKELHKDWVENEENSLLYHLYECNNGLYPHFDGNINNPNFLVIGRSLTSVSNIDDLKLEEMVSDFELFKEVCHNYFSDLWKLLRTRDFEFMLYTVYEMEAI